MLFFARSDLQITRLAELAGLEQAELRRLIGACRWKTFRHWQCWLTAVAALLFLLFLAGVITLWYVNLSAGIFNQLLISCGAVAALLSIFTLAAFVQLVRLYYLSPYLMQAMAAGDAAADTQADHGRNQQRRKKIIIRVSSVFALLLLTVVACVTIAMQSPGMAGEALKMPATLTTARIVRNQPGISKKVMLEELRLGAVTDMVFSSAASGGAGETVIAGSKGALFVSPGLPARFIAFAKKQNLVNHVRLGQNLGYGFMNRGAWCSDAALLDETGKSRWSYAAGGSGIDDMAAGDLDGDGVPEFVVGFNGGGGVHLLDSGGKKLWEYPDANVWHLEIADLEGNGKRKIVHSNAAGQITVRDSLGKVVSRQRPAAYFSDFSLLRWPDANSPERLLQFEENTAWILDANGQVLAKFPAPDSGRLGKGKGVLIPAAGENRLLATIVDFDSWQRSILYLHARSGELLYQEILPESCSAIAAPPGADPAAIRLLLGCGGKVVEYTLPGRLTQ